MVAGIGINESEEEMSLQKVKPFRNKKILQLAKGEDCTHCGANDGTTVAAHEDGLASGRGLGLKAPDNRVAYLCHKCHFIYDARGGDFYISPQRELNFYRAMLKTQEIWLPKLYKDSP